jgi:hypothetical protein
VMACRPAPVQVPPKTHLNGFQVKLSSQWTLEYAVSREGNFRSKSSGCLQLFWFSFPVSVKYRSAT